MKHLRVISGLALIPLCAWVGSLVSIGAGSGVVIGVALGITLSFLFLNYGPGHAKSRYPTSYYLNHDHQLNGGVNQQAMDDTASGAREEDRSPLIYLQYPPPRRG
jgi:hypothetical protein